MKNVRDEDKLGETLVGRYVVIDKFDRWVKSLKYRLSLKKGNPNKITRKEFDKLNTREEWRKETGIDETSLKRRRRKDGSREFDVIHNLRHYLKDWLENTQNTKIIQTLKTTQQPSRF